MERTDTPPPSPREEGPLYPCVDCGKLRTKAEGGTTFTVCDSCWDKKHSKTKPEPGITGSGESAPLYADRDHMALEPHFSAHMMAMTTEGLYGKAKIAAELAYRDARVKDLERRLAAVRQAAAFQDEDMVSAILRMRLDAQACQGAMAENAALRIVAETAETKNATLRTRLTAAEEALRKLKTYHSTLASVYDAYEMRNIAAAALRPPPPAVDPAGDDDEEDAFATDDDKPKPARAAPEFTPENYSIPISDALAQRLLFPERVDPAGGGEEGERS